MTPFFTIATISYNSSKYIKQAIESVLASTFENFEFLISDDRSTDNTWEIIETYKDPRIRSWQNQENLGEYANRNKVLFEAKGKYIFYIDGDDILYKDTLKNLHHYLSFFHDVGAVWGVPVREIDFAVLPYLFSSKEMMQLVYLSKKRYFSVIGLAETVFNVAHLKQIGGFSLDYMTGDTYVKRKLALVSSVLMIPEGLSYWRRSEGQASKRATRNFRSFLELYNMNREIISDKDFPLDGKEKQQVLRNVRISEVKLLISNTLPGGKFSDFLRLRKQIGVNLADLKYLFEKGKYDYQPVADVSSPLKNSYHFSNARAIVNSLN